MNEFPMIHVKLFENCKCLPVFGNNKKTIQTVFEHLNGCAISQGLFLYGTPHPFIQKGIRKVTINCYVMVYTTYNIKSCAATALRPL